MKKRFDVIFKHATTILLKEGFRKTGMNFYGEKQGNICLIGFIKHKYSGPENELFTIDIGIWSKNLSFLWGYSNKTNPEIGDCHWKCRIGHLLPVNNDYWWEIDQNKDLDSLGKEIEEVLLNTAMPAIEKHFTDAQLETNWLGNELKGVNSTTRYLYLTGLAKIYNRPYLTDLMNEFESYCDRINYKEVFEQHKERLEAWSNEVNS